MQGAADKFEGGVRATGGALEQSKICWYLMDYIWKYGKWTHASKADTPAELTVRYKDGKGCN